MNPLEIIEKYYNKEDKIYDVLVFHSKKVTEKALEIAKKNKHLNPNFFFIKEASMLHDIGIFLTDAPDIFCFGKKPYICHGFLGREILEKEGLFKHALVCERHVGIGIQKEEIKDWNLPLPKRDMIPFTIEEKIICLADKFYSKKKEILGKEKTIEEIREEIKRYKGRGLERFEELIKLLRY